MLVAYKQLFPVRLLTTETKSFELEPSVQVPVFFPKLFFINTATNMGSTMTLVITQKFTVGPSDDPLLSANYSSNTTTTLDPQERFVFSLDTIAIDGVLDLHTITITNNGAGTEVLQCWFEGLYEESMKITPNYPPVII